MSSMRRALPLILALALLVPATAAQASPTAVIRDCTDDEVLQGTYTQAELRRALAQLDADADEYTNCRDVIRAAQLAGAGGGGGGAPSGGGGTTTTPGTTTGPGATPNAAPRTSSAPGPFGGFSGIPADPAASATPAERQALDEARLDPTAAKATALPANALPAPLAIALALGAVGVLVLLALELRRRVLARRGA